MAQVIISMAEWEEYQSLKRNQDSRNRSTTMEDLQVTVNYLMNKYVEGEITLPSYKFNWEHRKFLQEIIIEGNPKHKEVTVRLTKKRQN